ncbi:MAG: MptD family putative ECF transporter S component [Clostridiales Family XIII bacterium]|jgi:energy-coupling factor transport system substrate-specific component|nr:MptD family putative ECF transporter S component [Clostridiales Family XIII bacterium]
MNQNKLKAKDLISLAIFSVVFIAVYMACALPTGLIVQLYPFCAGIAMVPCGIVWAYLRTKAPKPLAILIQGVLFAVIVFIMGSGWFVSAGVLAGAVLAELFARIGAYKSFTWNVVGYAAFAVCFNLGMFGIILIARDYYYDFCIESGMTEEYMQELLSFINGPLLALSSALSAAGAVIGMLLGRVFLKKHFIKAGIV